MTLENTEKPKCSSDTECLAIIAELQEDQRPLDVSGHGADPKCRSVAPAYSSEAGADNLDARFFHRMSTSPPYESVFPVSKAPNVVPEAFRDTWPERVNEWGGFMKQS